MNDSAVVISSVPSESPFTQRVLFQLTHRLGAVAVFSIPIAIGVVYAKNDQPRTGWTILLAGLAIAAAAFGAGWFARRTAAKRNIASSVTVWTHRGNILLLCVLSIALIGDVTGLMGKLTGAIRSGIASLAVDENGKPRR